MIIKLPLIVKVWMDTFGVPQIPNVLKTAANLLIQMQQDCRQEIYLFASVKNNIIGVLLKINV